MHTNTIVILTQVVRQLLNNLTFRDYANNDFNAINDANLINAVIQNNVNPLIIIRLLNYRDESQRNNIDKSFRNIIGNNEIPMIQHIRNYMLKNSELPYLFALLK